MRWLSILLLTTIGWGQHVNLTKQSQKVPWSIQPGFGDGTNVITAGTYTITQYYNDTGKTITFNSIRCRSDNNGSSTLNVTNGAGTSFLTGAITCTSSTAAGTLSGTITLAPGDIMKFTYTADGASKEILATVGGVHP